MNPRTETIQETSQAGAPAFCLPTGTSLRFDRQAAVTATMESSWYDQRCLTEKIERCSLGQSPLSLP